MPMSFIAIHDDLDLSTARWELPAIADAHGYQLIPWFATLKTLLSDVRSTLRANNYDCLDTLEVIAHSGATVFDEVYLSDAPTIGEILCTTNMCDDAKLYLNGCNTAINEKNRYSLAQIISLHGPKIAVHSTRLTVYGTVGYITGWNSDGTARAFGNRGVEGPGIDLPGYPDAPDGSSNPGVNIGSHDAIGPACWRAYREGQRVIL
jgi:hypothetical protein